MLIILSVQSSSTELNREFHEGEGVQEKSGIQRIVTRQITISKQQIAQGHQWSAASKSCAMAVREEVMRETKALSLPELSGSGSNLTLPGADKCKLAN